MTALLRSFAAFNQWPGVLLYHLALTLLVGLITFFALSRYRNHPAATWARLGQLGGGLLILRLLGLGMTLLALAWPLPAWVAPPVWLRTLSALTLVALLWAFALPPGLGSTLGALGLGGLIAVSAGVSEWLWLAEAASNTFYNGLPADGWWALGQSLLALGGVALVLFRRPPLGGVALGMFVLLWVGNTLHYLFPPVAYDAPLAAQAAESLALTLLALSLAWDTAHAVTPALVAAAPANFREGRPTPNQAPDAQLVQLRSRLAKLAQELAEARAYKAQHHATLVQTEAELMAARAEVQRLTLRLQTTPAETLTATEDPEPLPAKAVEVIFSNLRDELQHLRQQLTVVPPTTLGEKNNKGTAPLALPQPEAGLAQVHVCQHLGLPGDPETHNAFASPQHRCYAYKNPWKITSPHQDHFCLQGAHTRCPVFARQETAPSLPIDFVSQPSDPVTPSVWQRLSTLTAPRNGNQSN